MTEPIVHDEENTEQVTGDDEPWAPAIANTDVWDETIQATFDKLIVEESIIRTRKALAAAKVSFYLTRAGVGEGHPGTAQRDVEKIRKALDVLLPLEFPIVMSSLEIVD